MEDVRHDGFIIFFQQFILMFSVQCKIERCCFIMNYYSFTNHKSNNTNEIINYFHDQNLA